MAMVLSEKQGYTAKDAKLVGPLPEPIQLWKFRANCSLPAGPASSRNVVIWSRSGAASAQAFSA